jgi:hypothetical protein
MKSKIFLLGAFFFALTMFHPAEAKADSIWDILGGLFGNGGNGGNGGQGTNLPINSDVIYLVIAAAVIGVIAIKKANSRKIAGNKA